MSFWEIVVAMSEMGGVAGVEKVRETWIVTEVKVFVLQRSAEEFWARAAIESLCQWSAISKLKGFEDWFDVAIDFVSDYKGGSLCLADSEREVSIVEGPFFELLGIDI